MKQMEKNLTIRKTMCLPSTLWDKVEREANRVGMTQNGVIRGILEIYFAEAERKEALKND